MRNSSTKLILLTLLFSIGYISCKKEKNNPEVEPEITVTPGRIITTSIGGEVIDENGNPVNGATVSIGTTTMQTNSNGLFLFRDVSVNENKAYVKVEKNGFFLGSRNIVTKENSVSSVKIKLLSNNTINSFLSSTGGIISNEGVSLDFPANAIKYESGGAYSGTVNLAIKFLDPNSDDIDQIMPGDLRAINSNGEERLLETFGMAAIELTSPSGQKLNIADGKKIEMTIPLSGTYLTDAPSTIPLWYFDEVNGIWKEEGSATKVGSNYIGEVSHFSFWNCDNPNPSTSISGTIKCGSTPLANVKISISNSSGRTLGTVITDNLGSFSGFIPLNSLLTIKVYSINSCAFSPIYVANIPPASSPLILPTINACSGTVDSTIISGKIIDCSGNPVTNGVLSVNIGGIKSSHYTDAMGNINTLLVYCSASSVTLTAYDFNNLKSSVPQSFSIGTTINFGTITACNTLNEYISYNLDGTNYSILGIPGDTLHITPWGPQTSIYCKEHSTGLKQINLIIQGSAVGSFSTQTNQVNSITGTSSSVVTTLTSVGSAIGSFSTGYFSGTFIHGSLGTTHNISGNFKLRRKF